MIKHILASAFCITMSSQTSFAAEVPADDTWGIAFWVFIGYCTLIIIPQALSAFRFLISPQEGMEKKDSETESRAVVRDTTT